MSSRGGSPKLDLLQGTLDMLILKTLLFGPTHGRGIANYLRQTTDRMLSVEQGSLYPALHRLERARLIAGTWEVRSGSPRFDSADADCSRPSWRRDSRKSVRDLCRPSRQAP